MAVAVRHEELRQRLAYGGDEDIGAVRLDAGDQLWSSVACRSGSSLRDSPR